MNRMVYSEVRDMEKGIVINNLALKLPREPVSGFLGMLFSRGG
jgi:hypothetical protein